jgi:CRP-like cAMP-binding protein
MKRSGRRPPAWAGREGDLPTIRRLAAGDTLISQGEDSNELYLVLDGVLTVSMDGEDLAEVAPGAIVGERAALEGGVRTSTLTAVTPVKVAVAPHEEIDPAMLQSLATGHRREESAT